MSPFIPMTYRHASERILEFLENVVGWQKMLVISKGSVKPIVPRGPAH